MNKIDKIKDIIQDIYRLEDRIKALKIDKISDSNEFYDFCWVVVMLKDEEEKLQKKEDDILNLKCKKVIHDIFNNWWAEGVKTPFKSVS